MKMRYMDDEGLTVMYMDFVTRFKVINFVPFLGM